MIVQGNGLGAGKREAALSNLSVSASMKTQTPRVPSPPVAIRSMFAGLLHETMYSGSPAARGLLMPGHPRTVPSVLVCRATEWSVTAKV